MDAFVGAQEEWCRSQTRRAMVADLIALLRRNFVRRPCPTLYGKRPARTDFSRNAKTFAKGVYMRSHKLSALLLALLFGTLASAAAAQIVVAPAPAPYTSDNQSVIVVQPAPSAV